MRSPLLLGTALLAALTLSTLARADVAPPFNDGYVEACTVDKQAAAGRECLSCSAYHGNAEHCAESLASYGFERACRTRGASVWAEVWCRPSSPEPRIVPKDVLGQLDNASAHPPALPAATGTLPIVPAPLAVVAPPAPAAAAAPIGPPPVPPKDGCDVTPGSETAIWAPLLALGALAIGWSRRRARR
jgi:hypothetical protein